MANQRKKTKKLVGFYASPEEKASLEEAAKARGLTLSELLRLIANGTIKLTMGILLAFHLACTDLGTAKGAWTAKSMEKTAKIAWSKTTTIIAKL
jgi:hypothetical protein